MHSQQHCFLFSICSTSLVVSVMLSTYAKLSSTYSERESGCRHAENWVYLGRLHLKPPKFEDIFELSYLFFPFFLIPACCLLCVL